MKNAIVIKADDWEGLFIDGNCAEQGHSLNEGQERLEYFVERGRYYHFDVTDVVFKRCTEEYYNGYLSENGRFPDALFDIELEL